MPSKRKKICPAPGLHKLNPENLTVGELLPGALCTIDGRIMLREGQILKPEVLNRLRERLAEGIFGGAEWPTTYHAASEVTRSADSPAASQIRNENTPKELASFSVDELQPGTRLTSNLYTNRGALLAKKGAEITSRLLAKLKQYCIFEVQLGDPEPADTKVEPSETRPAKRRKVPPPDTPKARRVLPLADLQAELKRGKVLYQESIDRVGESMEDAFRGKRSSTTVLRQVISDFVGFLRMDPGVLPGLMMVGETPPEYLYQHGLNVALMAMSTATALNVSEEEIAEIGMGAIMQDIGMLSVPQTLRFAPRSLTDAERVEVQRHPIYSFDMLQRLGASETSLMIAYQAHERPDRSGYPNGRHRMLIHPHARLVSAADAYVALSSQRPHRAGCSPYEAMRTLLTEANENRLDPDAVRTILDCMSLFPLGSYVSLSDGTIAKVIRANPGKHTKPVVVALNADGSETESEIDLANNDTPQIVKAHASAPGLAPQPTPSTAAALVA